jgi:TolB-like protein
MAVAAAAGGGVWLWKTLPVSTNGPPRNDADAMHARSDASADLKRNPEAIRRSVSVMDFSAGSPDPQYGWMRDAIRDNLNSRLSGSPDCKVFSKEFIDFKAQQLVREGSHQDLRAATMEVAEKLGVTKAVLGSFRADGDALHIEAHIVDMDTGVQEASETVDGTQDQFVELQANLARKLMTRLGVTVPDSEVAAIKPADTTADLENYRLLMQAEGQPAVEPTPTRTPRQGEPKAKDRRGGVDPGSFGLDELARPILEVLVPTSYALESEETAFQEEQIRDTLEKYRRACEQKDLDLLRSVYDDLTPAQIDANRKYFQNARNLAVSFEEIDIALGQNEAAVSYTRKDRFIDNETQRPTKVEVRLTKILVLIDGTWKIASGRKAK